MRDYAELVKDLRCHAGTCEYKETECSRYNKRFDDTDYTTCSEELCDDAADEIEELLAEVEHWKLEAAANETDRKYLIDENRKLVNSLMNFRVPTWISVEDELPKNAGQMCLVCAKNSFGQQSVFNAFRGYGDFNWYTYDTTKMRSRLDNNNAIALGWEITHWMPLPEPPKEEN